MKKYTRISTILFVVAIALSFTSCKNNLKQGTPSSVDHNTLLIANAGQIYSYNLDDNKVNWEHTKLSDTAGNRNYFAIDGQQIFLPFESGEFVSFDLKTGKKLWSQQIYGQEEGVREGSSDPNDEAEMLEQRKPLFMTTPLVDGENVLINSSGKPNQSSGYLYNFDKRTGDRKWVGELPTVFNIFAPVKYRNNYFVNSAVYLEMFAEESGVPTNYGMFDSVLEIVGETPKEEPKNQFSRPIYAQMQTDGERLFIGDENGKFYCFIIGKKGFLEDADSTDPENTFIRNPEVFKWTFEDSEFSFQREGITFLTNDALYVEMKTGLADKSCIFALKPKSGEVIWKKIINSDVLNWQLQNDKIAGHTKSVIFWMNADGENYNEFKFSTQPLSNLQWINDSEVVFVTKNGIEQFDIKAKKARLIYKKAIKENSHNNVQIKYVAE